MTFDLIQSVSRNTGYKQMMDNKFLAVIYKCKHVMSVHLEGVDHHGGVPVDAQYSCLDCGHILLLIARRIVVD